MSCCGGNDKPKTNPNVAEEKKEATAPAFTEDEPMMEPLPGLEDPVTGAQYVGGWPNFTDAHKSYMRKCLTKEIFDKYKGVKTEKGCTLPQCIKTGVDSPHLTTGATAGDQYCYDTFKDMFYPIIKCWHGFDPETQKHERDLDHSKIVFDDETKALFNKYVQSTRIRGARSLSGHFLPSSATDEDRAKVEEKLVKIFNDNFQGELKGQYYPLGSLTDEQKEDLRSNGFLFQMPKKTNCLYFSGAARNWPASRGIFHNEERTFLAWVNEEDHCRIISMSQDGDVQDVFRRFCEASNIFQENADIMYADHLGFIGTCPSNLGTGLRASVMVVLEEFNKDVELLETACKKLDLQPRGSSGEYSAAIGGKWDVSNKQRIGFSEVQLVQKMINGVGQLIKWEEQLKAGEKEAVVAEIEA